ncbi:MAG: sulfotransferase [Myxococcota bacterium]
MTLRVVGAGLGRTGTMSLKAALERLLGAPCYHMLEVFQHADHVALWEAAARAPVAAPARSPLGDRAAWRALLDGYAAAVDWPACAFWPELAHAFPDALVLLSTRDPQAWWRSASATIFPSIAGGTPEWRSMIEAVFARHFTTAIDDEGACIEAYERHVARVRAAVPRERLLEWQPGDGWEPLARALGVAVPDEPFPHTNTTEDFRARLAATRAPEPGR